MDGNALSLQSAERAGEAQRENDDGAERKRIEDRLAFQAQLLSAVHDAIIAVDEKMNITYWNNMAEEISGWTAEEATELSGKEIFNRMGVDSLWPVFTTRIDATGAFTGEIAAIRKNGSQVTVDLHMKRLYGPSGQFKGTVSTFRDVTKRKQAEEDAEKANAELAKRTLEIQYERQRFFDVLETLPVMVCLITPDYHITFANKAFRERIGEANGRHCFDYCCGFTKPCAFCESLVPLSTGKPHHWEFTSPDSGTVIDAYVFPFSDANGSPLVLEMDIDITERKRAEEALRESEARFSELSRNLAAEVDALRIFHQINTRYIRQEELQGIYKDILAAAVELTNADCGALQLAVDNGQALELIVHAGVSEAFARHFERVSDDKAVCGKAMAERARVIVDDVPASPIFDGSRNRQILLNEGIRCVQSTPMFSGVGNLVGMLTTHYKTPHEFNERELRMLDLLARQAADVVESIRVEEALRVSEIQARLLAEALDKKNRLVTDFFINISHEFKTPLTILMLGLELLETKARKMKGGDAIAGNLTAMKQNSYRLNRLVGNLLDITKLDAGFMQPKWEKADVSAMLRKLAQSVEPYASQRGLSLQCECEPAAIPFTTDGFMLERIVLNLLSNAIKHTPAGGRIHITCHANDHGISIAVTDTGEGIPDEKKAIIFDRFSQVDTRMTRASEGTGIGLALIKSFVELLGGRVSFESALGIGSTFKVELPVIQNASSNGMIEKSGMQMNKRVQMELSDIIAT